MKCERKFIAETFILSLSRQEVDALNIELDALPLIRQDFPTLYDLYMILPETED